MRRLIVGILVLLVVVACAAEPPPVPPAAQLDCGRIARPDCLASIALIRGAEPALVANAQAIVMDDTCPPDAVCDRQFAFDTVVVIIPRPVFGGGQVAFLVAGVDGPEFIAPWEGPLPDHVAARVPRG